KGSGGKRYRSKAAHDIATYETAAARLRTLETAYEGELPLVPDEPIDPSTLGLRVDAFGMDNWGKLFNARQKLALITFVHTVNEANTTMVRSGLDVRYVKAIVTYLAYAVDRLADYGSTLCTWLPTIEAVAHGFSRQTLSMIWDYCEAAPMADAGGSAS